MRSPNLTDADWAPLRKSTPAFRNWWRDYKSNSYDPTIPYVGISELAHFVACELLTKSGDGNLRPLFTSIERLLANQDANLVGLITIGFFETLIHEQETRYFDIQRLYGLLRGPHSRSSWKAAAAYVSPEAKWHAQRGFVRVVRYPKQRGSLLAFHATFAPKHNALWLYGLLQSGTARRGWHLRFKISDYNHAVYRIGEVQRLRIRLWPPLVKVSLRYTSENDRQYLSIFEDVKYEPRLLHVYHRVPRSAA